MAFAKAVADQGIPVWIHAFLDGRDTPPQSAGAYLKILEDFCKKTPGVQVATIGGRYYAMDRDQRWERIQKAYDAMVLVQGPQAPSPLEALESNYKNNITDEFVIPTIIGNYSGMKTKDGIFMANFRADRARQILEALLNPEFQGFAHTPIHFAASLGLV